MVLAKVYKLGLVWSVQPFADDYPDDVQVDFGVTLSVVIYL